MKYIALLTPIFTLLILSTCSLFGQQTLSLEVAKQEVVKKASRPIVAYKQVEQGNEQIYFFEGPTRDLLLAPRALLSPKIQLDSTLFSLEIQPNPPHYFQVHYPSDRKTQRIELNDLEEAFQVDIQLLLIDKESAKKRLIEGKVSVEVVTYTGQAAQQYGRYGLKLSGSTLQYRLSKRPIEGPYQVRFVPSNGRHCIEVTDTIEESTQRYRFYEPIPVQGALYSFESMDVLKQQVKLRKLATEERPYGYRKNHYVDLALLEKNTERNWDKNQKTYALLHFWGPWCTHCMKEMNRLNKWQSRMIKEDSPIQFLDYVFLATQKAAVEQLFMSQLKTLQEQGKADLEPTIVPTTSFRLTEQPARQAPNAVLQLGVINYPSYILINQEGKILHRHHGTLDAEFEAILEKYLEN